MNKIEMKKENEIKTITYMIRLYDSHHKSDSSALLEYAIGRIDSCPFMETKTFCSACPIHCYQKEYQRKIKEVMRYAGPRMLWHHPFLAISHVFETIKMKVRKKTA